MKKLFLFLSLIVFITGCKKSDDEYWYEPVIPVTLKGIEAVNIDNSAEFPVITASPVKKEAYMIGVKWITGNIPSEDDKFITPPVWGERYQYAASGYQKAVMCLNRFNDDIPAGTYVSSFFKEIESHYLPADVNEGFVLLVTPDPGEHSFRVEYYEGEQLKFSYDTQPIEFL